MNPEIIERSELFKGLEAYKADLESMLDSVLEEIADADELDQEGTWLQECKIAECDLKEGIKKVTALLEYLKS